MGVVFALARSLHSSGVISLLISSSISGTYRPGEFIFQCPIFLPFHTVHRVLKARILKWFAIFFLQWTTFCQNSPSWPVCPGWPHIAWLSFIELDKGVIHIIRLAVIIVSVCLPSDPLSLHLPSYLGFSYLGCGVAPLGHCPWRGVAFIYKLQHKNSLADFCGRYEKLMLSSDYTWWKILIVFLKDWKT